MTVKNVTAEFGDSDVSDNFWDFSDQNDQNRHQNL